METIKIRSKVEEQILIEIQQKPQTEQQVIVHCKCKGEPYADRIRIWDTTYLRDKDSSHESKLLHTYNISRYPEWMKIGVGTTVTFTLIFSSLPKECEMFDLIEDIPEFGGFKVKNIKRKRADVYRVNV